MIPDDNNPDQGNAEIAALQNQVFTMLVALIVISGTLTAYLYRQVSTTSKDIAMDQQTEAWMDTNEIAGQTFIKQLVEYGEKHKDFVPVLKKYGIAPVAGIPANAPAPPHR